MYGVWFLFALRTLARLFSSSGPSLVLFWLMHPAGLAWPTPLAAALGLHMVLRVRRNLAQMHAAGRGVQRVVLPFVIAPPVLLLLPGDGVLMVGWSAWMAACALMLWRARFIREAEASIRPAPISEADLWLDLRGGVLLATGGLGLALSLTGDPAVWITGTSVGAAGLELTALLFLRTRGHV